VRAFSCGNCGNRVFFENTRCLSCQVDLGFAGDRGEMVACGNPVPDRAEAGPRIAGRHRRCENFPHGCNWLVPEHGGRWCRSCALTRTRPAEGDQRAVAAWEVAEAAKRRLVFQLCELGLPIVDRAADPAAGLAFDLLLEDFDAAGRPTPVVTGHADGIITVDLSESDDAHRERLRGMFGEPLRTVLGHFRHEIGHYYWPRLVDGPGRDRFRSLFGDERLDYSTALEEHYERLPTLDGPPEAHVSAYATAHPWEDWAETFAHYLHIRDTLQTADAEGVTILPVGAPGGAGGGSGGPATDPRALHRQAQAGPAGDFDALINRWLPLARALNGVNQSMGLTGLYPFVLGPAVLEKLRFVHDVVAVHATGGWAVA
jgi:hypothetical protein